MLFLNRKKINQKGGEIEQAFLFQEIKKIDDNIFCFLDEDDSKEEVEFRSTSFFWFLIFSSLLIIFWRCFQLQVVKGEYFRQMAEKNRTRIEIIAAPRGFILSAEGEILARNIPSFDLVFIPQFLPSQEEKRRNICWRLSKIIGLEEKFCVDFEKIIKERNNWEKTFLIKENIDYDKAIEIIERSNDFQGIFLQGSALREYPGREAFAHLIGYVGKITKEELIKNPDYLMTDSVGKSGLELSYDRFLHGKNGQHLFEVESNGKVKFDLGRLEPVKGNDLVLSINAGLQKKILEEAQSLMEKNKEATGVVVVAVNPQNGKVLALVNYPSFDNNLFSGGIAKEEYENLINNPQKPLFNKAISGEYPPGSTFKPMIAAAALEEGIITERTTINCDGGINIGDWNFPDWKAHGITDVKKAIAESCDVFFYALGGGWNDISGLGEDKIERYAKLFGFGKPTGIDLPGEASGLIPNESWKFKKTGERWYIGDSYHAAIGQGFVLVTPLQLAMVTATIANGGTLFQPQLVEKIINAETGQEEKINSQIIRKEVVSRESIEIVREGMKQTVFSSSGSGRSLASLKIESAGKTGTAQFGIEKKTHSWYISFAPFNQPEIAMVVLVEGGGEGHSWAVPLTKSIYEWYFQDYLERSNSDF